MGVLTVFNYDLYTTLVHPLYISQSYRFILEKLPKKVQVQIGKK